MIVPIPTEVAGVSPHITDLAGTWKFSLLPPLEFWSNGVNPASWSDVVVPGELTAQGHPIVRDSEYAYKRSMHIPAGAGGKKVFLRFDGVYSYARVWVNGKFVREHHGGFTSWDCDITQFVTPGQTAWLTVGVTDRADEISYASNYAKHYIGGILRGVKLLVLPADYVSRFHIETGPRFELQGCDSPGYCGRGVSGSGIRHVEFAIARSPGKNRGHRAELNRPLIRQESGGSRCHSRCRPDEVGLRASQPLHSRSHRGYWRARYAEAGEADRLSQGRAAPKPTLS